MKNYQLAVLADPDIVDESAEEIKNKIIASVQNEGGLVISSSKTEKRKLGHPIKGKISAFFFALDISFDPKKISQIKSNLNSEKSILRCMIIIKEMTEERPGKIEAPQKDPEEKKVELEKMDEKIDEILQ